MKKHFLFFLLFLAGCQTVPQTKEPLAEIHRRAETPLVLAIPGLNAIPGFDQSIQFGRLREVMAQENIPAEVVEYDSAAYPINDVADLNSRTRSIAILRVLPRIATAIAEENRVRESQGVPPLERLDFVSYSQGSVVLWDLMRRLGECKAWAQGLEIVAPDEWKNLQKDPAFQIFADTAMNFFLIRNIHVQNPELLEKSPDFKNIYVRGEENLKNGAKRFREHFYASPDYPRLQEKARRERKPPQSFEDIFEDDPLFQYIAFKELMPLEIRAFSICGSLLGSPEANRLSARPLLLGLAGARAQQIRDTRLGSRHHLEWMKEFFEKRVVEKQKPLLAAGLFVVGVNGKKGDGLVDQSSAHLSGHGLAELSWDELSTARKIEWQKLPDSPVVGLPVVHLTEKEFLFWERPAAPEIGEKGNPVTEVLIAFEKGEPLPAKNLPLNQFSVAVYLPDSAELDLNDLSLKSTSKGAKLTGKFENKSSNAVVWTGVFDSPKEIQADLTLEIKNRKDRMPVSIPVAAGKSYFLEIN